MTAAPRPTVLLVEDVEDNREIVRQLAAFMQVDLLVAGDGLEGVRLAKEARPALILMDLSLPLLDGWEATARLKADPETAGIPVIALTAHARDEDRERAARAGAEGYITKPFSVRDLRETVERMLAGGRA